MCIKDIQTLARDKGKMMSVKFEQRRRDGSWRAYTWMASSICCFNIGWIAEKMKKSQKRSPIDIERSWHEFSCSALGVEAEHAFVRVVRAIALLGSGQERAEREPRYESPDMGPPRDAPAGGEQQELHH
jgi:hypothetical protein